MADTDWASIISGLIGGGIDLSHSLNHTDLENAQTAANVADPFSTQREGYQKQLKGLMTDPNSFKQDPGYQFALDQGLDSVARKGNAMFGGTRVGTTAIDLQKFGTGFASQAYDTRINELTKLSGADAGNPGEAGKILAGGYRDANKTTAGATAGLSNGIAGLVNALASSGMGSAAASLFKQMFGSNTDFSKMNVTGSFDDFMRSVGLDPSSVGSQFGIDESTWNNIKGVLNDPTGAVDGLGTGGSSVDPGSVLGVGSGISDSTSGLLNDTGIFTPTPLMGDGP